MSITTYSELKTAIQNYMDDTSLSSYLDDFIDLFEAHANRNLRTRQQVTSTTQTITDAEGTLPSDFLQWIRVTWPGSVDIELEYIEPGLVPVYYPDAAAGTPIHFTIEGSTIKVYPTDSTDLELVYYQKVPALSDSATTNWLLTAHPDAYLFGYLSEYEMFTKDGQAAAAWGQRRDAVMEEIRRNSEKFRGRTSIYMSDVTP